MVTWFAACALAEAPAPAAAPEPAPAIGVQPLGPIALRSKIYAATGRPRIVNFWATWCAPCVAEIPQLVAYAAAHPNVDVVMVDLDLPKLRASKVEPFLAEHKVAGIVHYQLDHADPVKAIYDVLPDFPDVIPITLVVDGEGSVSNRIFRQLTEKDIAALP